MRYFSFLLISCALLFSCGAKTTFEIINDDFGGAHKDYGGQVYMDTINVEYVLKNTGENNLLISQVEPDCSCTVGNFTKDPIKPGETGKIILDYHVVIPPDSEHGNSFKKEATVSANVEGGSFNISFEGYSIYPPDPDSTD